MGAVTANGQAYIDKNGNKVVGYNESASSGLNNNKAASSGTVQKDSIFDPTSKNYNKTVAESNGKISLGGVNNPSDGGSTSGGTGNKTSNADKRDRRDNISALNSANLSSTMQAAVMPTTTSPTTTSIVATPTVYTPAERAKLDYGLGKITLEQANAIINAPSPTTVYDPTDAIKALATTQKAAALAGLSSAHDKNLSDLSAANGKIEPAYYNQRNATSTDSQLAAKNFAEYLAQHGENNANGISGTNAQSDISNNVALQGNLGSLATSEAGAYADNAKQVGDTNVAYNNDIASSNANIDATSMASLIQAQQTYNAAKLAQANTDRGFNYQTGRDVVTDANNTWNQNNTVAQQNQQQANTVWGQNNTTQQQAQQQANTVWGQNNTTQQQALDQANTQWNQNNTTVQQAQQNAINVAGLTGMYNDKQTMQGASNAANVTGQNLQNDYQTLVNNGYPAQQALAMAQAKASITGANLQNDYQTLVNVGYPAQQAAQLAQSKAATAGQLLQNAGQSIQNKYMPQQLQGAINAQNANINQSNAAAAASNRSGYGGSGGGSSSGGGSTSDGRVNSGGTTNNGLTSAQYNTEFANASKTMLQAVQSGKGAAWIAANKAGLQALTTTNANGITKNAYNQMLDEYHANNQGTTIQAQDTHNDMINQKAIRNKG